MVVAPTETVRSGRSVRTDMLRRLMWALITFMVLMTLAFALLQHNICVLPTVSCLQRQWSMASAGESCLTVRCPDGQIKRETPSDAVAESGPSWGAEQCCRENECLNSWGDDDDVQRFLLCDHRTRDGSDPCTPSATPDGYVAENFTATTISGLGALSCAGDTAQRLQQREENRCVRRRRRRWVPWLAVRWTRSC